VGIQNPPNNAMAEAALRQSAKCFCVAKHVDTFNAAKQETEPAMTENLKYSSRGIE